MSCECSGGVGVSDPAGEDGFNRSNTVQVAGEPGTGTIPMEQLSGTKVVADQQEQMSSVTLERGQHRLQWFVEVDDHADPQLIRDQTKAIQLGDEYKRIHIYKLEVVPTDKRRANGRRLARVRVVIAVLDNPLPLIPIIWGLNIVAGSIGGWFLIDKVEEFTSTTGGSLTLTLAVAGALFFLIRWVLS